MPSLVKIGPVVLEKKIFKSSQFIFIIFQLSPLGVRRGPLNSLYPLAKDALCKVWLKLPCSGSGEEDENVKSLQTDSRTDGRQVIRKAQVSIQLS